MGHRNTVNPNSRQRNGKLKSKAEQKSSSSRTPIQKDHDRELHCQSSCRGVELEVDVVVALDRQQFLAKHVLHAVHAVREHSRPKTDGGERQLRRGAERQPKDHWDE